MSPSRESFSSDAVSVRVAVRIRPFNTIELEKECCEVVIQNPNDPTELLLGYANRSLRSFSYDAIYPMTSAQSDIYTQCITPLVNSFVQGYNTTVFAYGQTGSGKTYTMMNGITNSSTLHIDTDSNVGLIPRVFQHVWKLREQQKKKMNRNLSIDTGMNQDDDNPAFQSPKKTSQFMMTELKVSCIEIYNEDITDLMLCLPQYAGQRDKHSIRIISTTKCAHQVTGVVEHVVTSYTELTSIVNSCIASRHVGSTRMNAESSRSHLIVTLTQTSTKHHTNGAIETITSKFHFVDLAGSENLKKTGAEGKQMTEGIHINKALLALGNVISALGDSKRKNEHIPYRDSSLTRVLAESLSGNSQTVMIACISPADFNYEETNNTLKYAARARNMATRPVINRSKMIQPLIPKPREPRASILPKTPQRATPTKRPSGLPRTKPRDLEDDLAILDSGIESDIEAIEQRQQKRWEEYMIQQHEQATKARIEHEQMLQARDAKEAVLMRMIEQMQHSLENMEKERKAAREVAIQAQLAANTMDTSHLFQHIPSTPTTANRMLPSTPSQPSTPMPGSRRNSEDAEALRAELAKAEAYLKQHRDSELQKSAQQIHILKQQLEKTSLELAVAQAELHQNRALLKNQKSDSTPTLQPHDDMSGRLIFTTCSEEDDSSDENDDASEAKRKAERRAERLKRVQRKMQSKTSEELEPAVIQLNSFRPTIASPPASDARPTATIHLPTYMPSPSPSPISPLSSDSNIMNMLGRIPKTNPTSTSTRKNLRKPFTQNDLRLLQSEASYDAFLKRLNSIMCMIAISSVCMMIIVNEMEWRMERFWFTTLLQVLISIITAILITMLAAYYLIMYQRAKLYPTRLKQKPFWNITRYMSLLLEMICILAHAPFVSDTRWNIIIFARLYLIGRVIRDTHPSFAWRQKMLTTGYLRGRAPRFGLTEICHHHFDIHPWLCIMTITTFMGVISSYALYHIERDGNSDVWVFGNVVYLVITTMTNAGFVDLVPVTDGGKFILSCISMYGVILIGLVCTALFRSSAKHVTLLTRKASVAQTVPPPSVGSLKRLPIGKSPHSNTISLALPSKPSLLQRLESQVQKQVQKQTLSHDQHDTDAITATAIAPVRVRGKTLDEIRADEMAKLNREASESGHKRLLRQMAISTTTTTSTDTSEPNTPLNEIRIEMSDDTPDPTHHLTLQPLQPLPPLHPTSSSRSNSVVSSRSNSITSTPNTSAPSTPKHPSMIFQPKMLSPVSESPAKEAMITTSPTPPLSQHVKRNQRASILDLPVYSPEKLEEDSRRVNRHASSAVRAASQLLDAAVSGKSPEKIY